MARHLVYRRNAKVDEYQELPDAEQLEPDAVTVTLPDGSLRSYHVEDGLGGSASSSRKPESWCCASKTATICSAPSRHRLDPISGTALGDRGRRSSTAAEIHHRKPQRPGPHHPPWVLFDRAGTPQGPRRSGPGHREGAG